MVIQMQTGACLNGCETSHENLIFVFAQDDIVSFSIIFAHRTKRQLNLERNADFLYLFENA